MPTMPRNQKEIEEKVLKLNEEVNSLVAEADAYVLEIISGKISFKYEVSAPVPELSPYERAQSLCFVTKYDSLPGAEPPQVDIREHNGRFYPNNIDSFRHLLNEYRPIIQNSSDSTHFSKVHHLCRSKLKDDAARKGLSISVEHENGSDVTIQFLRLLDQKNRAITRIIGACEFDYIYNGILQHSDHEHTERYIKEYCSGELHYVFIKHAMVCAYIREELSWHRYLLGVLSGVRMGPM